MNPLFCLSQRLGLAVVGLTIVLGLSAGQAEAQSRRAAKAAKTAKAASSQEATPASDGALLNNREHKQLPEPEYDMFAFMRQNLRYPEDALEANVEGQVIVGMLVGRDGSLRHHKVVKSLGHGTDEEALRVAKMLPPFKPGLDADGTPQEVMIYQPISFRQAKPVGEAR